MGPSNSEFSPSSLRVLLGLVALTRALVAHQLTILDKSPHWQAGEPETFWLATENRWLASRYGLQAVCAHRSHTTPTLLRDDCLDLVRGVSSTAHELGDLQYLEPIHEVLTTETGAERQRRIFRQSGSWHAVVNDMREQLAAELSLIQPREQAADNRATAATPPPDLGLTIPENVRGDLTAPYSDCT